MKRAALVVVLGIAVPACCQNLVVNGDFEGGAGEKNLPVHWETWNPSGTPVVRLADDQKHEGGHALYMETKVDAHAIAMSEPIAVAPGEKVTLSAWCKVQDMSTTSSGTFGIAAGWMDFTKTYMSFAAYQTVPVQPSRDWFEITTTTVVPPRVHYLTFQVRHRSVTGKSWWDEAKLTAETPIVLRLGLTGSTAEPGKTTIPATLINRDPARAGNQLSVKTDPGSTMQQVTVGSSTETSIVLNFNVTKRGKLDLSATLLDVNSKPVFSTQKEVTVPEELVMEPALPCYSCMEDSEPSVEDRIWVHEPDELRNSMVLECTLRRSGKSKAQPIASLSIQNPGLENRPNFNVGPLDKLGKGDYEIQATLKSGNKPVATGTQDWHIISRAQAKVTVSPDGWTVVDGKKTLPMGLYDGDSYPELAAAGLNVTQNFDVGHVRRGFLPDNKRMKRMLDDGMAVGMKHLFLVAHGPGCRVLDDEYLRRVRIFKNHPGVLAWYEEEGVARGDVPLTFVKDLRDTMNKLAPEHPLVIGDTLDVISKMTDRSNFFPADYMDIGTWWWYPFPIRAGGRPGAYEGEEIGQHLELVPPSFLTLAKTTKPIWVVMQSYKKDNGRFPTDAEYRAQPYISIIHGAKGLFWYTGAYIGGVQREKRENHYDYVRQLWRELREMEPVFLAADAKEKVTAESGGQFLDYRMKDVGDKRVLLAVNRDDHPTSASFIIEGFTIPPVDVRYEKRKLQSSGDRFNDSFAPYAVHVYEMAKPPE